MRILISGASGLIGSALREQAQQTGHEVGALVRGEPDGAHQWRWDPARGSLPAEAIGWADAVVNLSGASIGRVPWTRSYRRELRASRIDATTTLVEAIRASENPPSVFVSGSAVGFYGDRPGEVLDERSAPGSGFLADLTKEWEAAAAGAADVTRVVTLRTGLVLADGGALTPLLLATRAGAGARVGSGTQIWPWIGLDDEVGAILHLLTSDVSGPVNLVAPGRTSSQEITRTLAAVVGRPHLFALPAPLLRLPLGPAADELLLLSQDIRPDVLTDSGYRFRQPDLADALESAVHGTPAPPLAESQPERPPSEPTSGSGSPQAAPGPTGDGAEPGQVPDTDPEQPQALAKLTVAELRARAKDRGLTGYSRLTKAQLVDLLADGER